MEQTMKPKIILCLALVLSGSPNSSHADDTKFDTNNNAGATNFIKVESEQPFYVEENQIFELKDKLWEAVRATNAAAFVNCYYIPERFDTPEVREANRKQVEKFIQSGIIDMQVNEIPKKELEQIIPIQSAYSLVPKKILEIRRKTGVGWRLLIGNKNDKWYIITVGGFST